MKLALPAVALCLWACVPAPAHRLDEYLQGTLISVEKNRVDAQITLTPGVAVFPFLIPDIDADGNGVVSTEEQHSYAERVLRDLSLTIDGQSLAPHLRSMDFPALEEMKEGRGEIHIEWSAHLPAGGRERRLVFENRHQRRIAAYQVNCLVPRDRDIQIIAQKRNYTQSFYELDFAQQGTQSGVAGFNRVSGAGKPLGTVALLLAVRMFFLWMQRARLHRLQPADRSSAGQNQRA